MIIARLQYRWDSGSLGFRLPNHFLFASGDSHVTAANLFRSIQMSYGCCRVLLVSADTTHMFKPSLLCEGCQVGEAWMEASHCLRRRRHTSCLRAPGRAGETIVAKNKYHQRSARQLAVPILLRTRAALSWISFCEGPNKYGKSALQSVEAGCCGRRNRTSVRDCPGQCSCSGQNPTRLQHTHWPLAKTRHARASCHPGFVGACSRCL